MKILSAAQIRELDAYTISNEPIASVELMERAATAVFGAVAPLIPTNASIHVFCGMGNNGGDGLALARLMIEAGYLHQTTHVVVHAPKASPDFSINESRLKNLSGIHYIETERQIPPIDKHSIVIDALFGTGLSHAVEGISAAVITAINRSGATVYSVDMPSGLFCDIPNSEADVIIQSDLVLTFHAPKLSFMFAAGGKFVSRFQVLNIGLINEYAEHLPSNYFYTTGNTIQPLIKPRQKFSHKGTYGHALIWAGEEGKMGAAVLAVKAALKSGAGLVTALIPPCGFEIMQITNPEAMVLDDDFSNRSELKAYDSVAIGPGLGTYDGIELHLTDFIKQWKKPLVLDADALNAIAAKIHLKRRVPIPPFSILTPHPGEFRRLAGTWKDDADKLEKQIQFSKEHQVIVVLKGAHTSVSTPEGLVYFNSTGNPGMAKGGSGDALTGVLAALLAQQYSPFEASLIGVYIHGLAGDLAAGHIGQTGMTAGDLITHLPKAFKEFE